MDTFDETLSPDDLAQKGVGMIAAALMRTSMESGNAEAANLAKSCLTAIHAAGLDYMQTIYPAGKTLDDVLDDGLSAALAIDFARTGGLAA